MSVGTQRQVSAFVVNGYKGDLASVQTPVNLTARSMIAKGLVNIGQFVFRVNANQAQSVKAGSSGLVAGFTLRNQGSAQSSYEAGVIGYTMIAEDGKTLSVAQAGDFFAVITGVDALGVADHIPTYGEQLWAKDVDGSVASAPSSIATVTGYTKVSGMYVNQVNLITTGAEVISVFSTFGVISGFLQVI